MAQWDGVDAKRVRQIGLINTSPRLGAVLRHRPLPPPPPMGQPIVQTGSGSRDRRPAP